MENIVVGTYAFYIALSVCLTVWVARTLHKNGRVFLVEVFHGDEKIADSVNHLLVVGFYLINLGYVTLALKIGDNIASDSARVSRRFRGRSAWFYWSSAECISLIFLSLAAFTAGRRFFTAGHRRRACTGIIRILDFRFWFANRGASLRF